MDIDPFIKPKLVRLKNKWYVELQECWPENVNYFGNATKLDSTVDWCTIVLENWAGCRRMSWDTWLFDTKKNAEKFIIYYNIACPQ